MDRWSKQAILIPAMLMLGWLATGASTYGLMQTTNWTPFAIFLLLAGIALWVTMVIISVIILVVWADG